MARAAATDSLFDRILETSTTLFAEHGVDKTSMRMIAESLGVTKAALYYHVDNKDDLHHKIHGRVMDSVLEALREIATSDLDPVAKVRAVIDLSLHSIAAHRDAHTVFFREVGRLDQPSWRGVAEKRREFRRTVFGILESGVEQGTFEIRDVDGATLALLGMCNWAYTWVDPTGPRSIGDTAELFGDIFLGGILK
jgi:AcrR family transcriptional regulator